MQQQVYIIALEPFLANGFFQIFLFHSKKAKCIMNGQHHFIPKTYTLVQSKWTFKGKYLVFTCVLYCTKNWPTSKWNWKNIVQKLFKIMCEYLLLIFSTHRSTNCIIVIVVRLMWSKQCCLVVIRLSYIHCNLIEIKKWLPPLKENFDIKFKLDS